MLHVKRLARAHPFAASCDYWILIFTILIPSGAVDLGVDKPVSYFVGNESVFSNID